MVLLKAVHFGNECLTIRSSGRSALRPAAELKRQPDKIRSKSMTSLGTSKKPAVVRVRTQARAEEILAICDRQGWKVIVGLEPYQDEDISDVERLLHPREPAKAATAPGRNDPCPCGSGRKYKKCCGANGHDS